jgi:Ca-activated chloride channel homolog
MHRLFSRASLLAVGFFFTVSFYSFAQQFSLPWTPGFQTIGGGGRPMNTDQSIWLIDAQAHTPEEANGFLSKLDLKAPGKARREYEKGHQLLLKNDLPGALEHLTTATSIYPSFVAAHNALGSAYLGLTRNADARAEFSRAIELDDHLPNSYFNLGCAQLALQDYPAAEQSMQKASNIAPLDVELLTALAYGQLMNQNFDGTIATVNKIHERQHLGAALVHFYAAAAYEAERKFPEAQHQLDTMLTEAPNSPAAAKAVEIKAKLTEEALSPPPQSASAVNISLTNAVEEPTGPVQLPERVRKLMQDAKENGQIAEAEASEPCAGCPSPAPPTLSASASVAAHSVAANPENAEVMFHSSVDEVGVFFAATDHGKPVSTLRKEDLHISDNHLPPAAIMSLRNESQLPLRLGLIIDTSDSISTRFKFEQSVATNFLQSVLTGSHDLAFVVGFANSVLLVQDFTGDHNRMSHAVDQLVASGGTRLWDAVDFAADKLASRSETQPVAKILVVISDGEDNSSSITAKEAIGKAQRGGVSVYTVCTRDLVDEDTSSLIGEHALSTLADLTGGAEFTPGSVHGLKASLNDIQDVIRSRYLVSYKPDSFKRDGEYRPIEIAAEKDGHKLHVFARKGYYAATTVESTHF